MPLKGIELPWLPRGYWYLKARLKSLWEQKLSNSPVDSSQYKLLSNKKQTQKLVETRTNTGSEAGWNFLPSHRSLTFHHCLSKRDEPICARIIQKQISSTLLPCTPIPTEWSNHNIWSWDLKICIFDTLLRCKKCCHIVCFPTLTSAACHVYT